MVKNKVKTTATNLFFNYSSLAFTITTGVFLVPFYLKYIPIDLYGAWLVSGSILAIMGLVDGGLNLVFSQRLAAAAGKNHWELFNITVFSGVVCISFVAFLMILVSLCIFPFIPQITNYRGSDIPALELSFILALFSSILSIVHLYLGSIAHAWQETFYYGLSMTVSSLVGLLVTILLLFSDFGLLAIPSGLLAKGLVAVSIVAFDVMKEWRRNDIGIMCFDKENLLDLVRSTVPVFVSRSGGLFISNFQVILLSNVFSPLIVANYSFTSKIFEASKLVLSPIGSSMFSGLAQSASQRTEKSLFDLLKKMFLIVGSTSLIIGFTAFLVNKQFVGLWLSSDKYLGDTLNLLLLISFLLSAKVQISSLILTATGVIGKTAVAGLVESLIKVIFLTLFVKNLGYLALPIIEIVTVTFVSLFTLMSLLKRRLNLDWISSFDLLFSEYKNMFCVMGAAIVFYLFQIQVANWMDLSFFISAIVIVFCVLSVLVNCEFRMFVYKLLRMTVGTLSEKAGRLKV
jgi:O-antigen/teichoic acid export membrane protein